MRRPTTPPTMAELDATRAAAGDAVVSLRLDPLVIQLDGLSATQQSQLIERYAPYVEAGAVDRPGTLRVQLVQDDVEYFIDPPRIPELVPVQLVCDGGRIRYQSYQVAGWFDTIGGEGRLLLARGSFEPFSRAVENYIRSAVAWQAATRGGALVHAASSVLHGRGYLFYGESGAGKSTMSACNRRGRVISDDLSLVLPDDDGRPALIGSPFRGTYTGGPPVQGRFPLAAGFRLIQASQAAVRTVSRVRAFSELVGNLPFVAEKFAEREDLFDAVRTLFSDVPLAHLEFCKDDSYWDAIAAAGL